MNFYINRVIIVITLLFTFVGVSFAQNENPSNLTNSAYTRYGFGKLGSVANASTRAMGDLGVVSYSNSYTNLYNPASLTAIDTLTMLAEAGLNAEWQFSTENGRHQSDFNSGFNYFSLHFPLWRNFAGALSLTPYSMVGYYYGAETSIHVDNSLIQNDTLVYNNTYQGTGGLQKIMASIGWRPYSSKKASLNVGLNLAYIYGSVNHAGNIYISTSQGQNTYISRSYTAKGFEVGLGVQYLHRIGANRSLLFGGTFSPKTPINTYADNIKYSNTDTISTSEKLCLKAPMKFGFGVSYIVDRKLLIGAEFTMDNWGNVAGLDANLRKSDGIYKNISKVAVGIEYQPSVFNQNYFKTCHYRAGANIKNSYIETYGSQNREYTVSGGIGFPVGSITRRRSILNIALEYTHVQPSKSELLKEDYINISIGITFNEMMFFRNRLY